MSTGILRTFYSRTAWTKCRDAFFMSKFGLCEDCGSPGQMYVFFNNNRYLVQVVEDVGGLHRETRIVCKLEK